MSSAAKSPPFFIRLLNAMDGSDLTANERAVLMAQFQFGTHANGRGSYVGEARLAECLQVSVSTIRRARRALQDKGWLIERNRGHGGPATPETNKASNFDIAIPPMTVAPAPKPKRAPNNPQGRNGRSKQKLEVTGDLGLQVKPTSKPSKVEVTGDHLSGLPETDALRSSDCGGTKRANARRGSGCCSECGGGDQRHEDACSLNPWQPVRT